MGALCATQTVVIMADVADDRANAGAGGGAEGKVIYSCIANFNTKEVLSSFSSKWDQAPHQTAEIVKEQVITNLTGDGEQPPGCCAKYGKSKLFYTSLPEVGITVVHVCSEDYKVSYSLQFQQKIAEEWGDRNAERDAAFDNVLREQVTRFTINPPSNSKFDAVREKQDQVKLVLIDNIDEVMKRHGLIEINLDQTESLKQVSATFQQGAKSVRQKAQCQQYKLYGSVAAGVLVLIGILVIVICVSAKC